MPCALHKQQQSLRNAQLGIKMSNEQGKMLCDQLCMNVVILLLHKCTCVHSSASDLPSGKAAFAVPCLVH